MEDVIIRSYFTLGRVETSPPPPPDAYGDQYACIRSVYVHRMCTGYVNTRLPAPATVPLRRFFDDPRPILLRIVTDMTDDDDPPPWFVETFVRLSAKLNRLIAENPNYAGAPVVPLDLEIGVNEPFPSVAYYHPLLSEAVRVRTPRPRRRGEAAGELMSLVEAAAALEEVPASADRCCSICLEGFDDGDEDERGVRTQCRHVYHRRCIVEWWMRSRKCPLCRQTISSLASYSNYITPSYF